MRQPSQIITVDNIGDVPCGCQIVFKALGTVANPELMNVDTGEVLDSSLTVVGQIEATEVKEKVATCKALKGGDAIAKGMAVFPAK